MCLEGPFSARLPNRSAITCGGSYSEGRAAAALVHPNIVTTHAIGEARGYRFLEMEFVPGRSLQELVEYEQRLVPSRAMALILRIAEGLAAAHQKGIIHRDLKPDNVSISVQAVPKIADFGLAKRVWYERDEPENAWWARPTTWRRSFLTANRPPPPATFTPWASACIVMLTGQVPFPMRLDPAIGGASANETLPDFAEARSRRSAGNSRVHRPAHGQSTRQPAQQCLRSSAALDSRRRGRAGRRELVGNRLRRPAKRHLVPLTAKSSASKFACPRGGGKPCYIEPSAHAVADRLLIALS